MEDTDKRSGYHPGGVGVLVFVLIYFFFPHLLVLPFVALHGRSATPPPALAAFFWPVGYLCEHVRPYRKLIQTESDWTGIH